MDFEEAVFQLRETLLPQEQAIRNLMKHKDVDGIIPQPESNANMGEVYANIMLAVRHLEDCRMRLGKVIQSYNGGKSVYPR